MAHTRRDLDVVFADLAASDPRCVLQLQELKRIRNKLYEFLSPWDAQETAARIFDVVLQVDEELDRILADPLVRRLYEYDGQFFTPKQCWGFYRAFDGIHILQSLTDVILETFFCGRNQYFAIRWLMDELGKHTWEAKVRRINWEESRTLSVVPKEVLDQILVPTRRHDTQAGEENAPLSPEERAFLQSFEDQLAVGK